MSTDATEAVARGMAKLDQDFPGWIDDPEVIVILEGGTGEKAEARRAEIARRKQEAVTA